MVRRNCRHYNRNRSSHGSTCHVVSYPHCGECYHDKVDGLQCGPALYVFEDDSRDGDKNNAASQDEQDGGGHSDLGLADLFVFLLRKPNRRSC